ncbi:uncharacterized protein FFB14_09440 [Fusarium fujikuroi]|nr:uncharacterized protein FFB14_09440 [Fusarium fujikuroi]
MAYFQQSAYYCIYQKLLYNLEIKEIT